MEESIGYCEACLALDPGDVEIQQQLFESADGLLPHLIDSKNDQFL